MGENYSFVAVRAGMASVLERVAAFASRHGARFGAASAPNTPADAQGLVTIREKRGGWTCLDFNQHGLIPALAMDLSAATRATVLAMDVWSLTSYEHVSEMDAGTPRRCVTVAGAELVESYGVDFAALASDARTKSKRTRYFAPEGPPVAFDWNDPSHQRAYAYEWLVQFGCGLDLERLQGDEDDDADPTAPGDLYRFLSPGGGSGV